MVSMLNHRCLFIWQLVIYMLGPYSEGPEREKDREREETAIQMKKWKLYT